MKTFVLTSLFILGVSSSFGQNINDNKISFSYIQLPSIKIDEDYSKYELKIEHGYTVANEDSLSIFALRQQTALQQFEVFNASYVRQRDSLERMYLRNLSYWERQVNAGALTASGQPLPKPNPPVFPSPPAYPNIKAPRLHSEYSDAAIANVLRLQGFEVGENEVVISINLLPMRDIRIVQSRKGSGASIKYVYKCEYVQPIMMTIETPSQGILFQGVLFENKKSYKMKDQKSKYDHQLYMRDNAAVFYRDLEKYARQDAITSANNYLNEQVGFITKTRSTEIYSVKKFKDYDYSDVTGAYSATVNALKLVGGDRDRSGAQDNLDAAMEMWEEIMMESNTYDKKARINDKISAMIQCNMAEIQLWQSNFSSASATLDLAMNAGVLKAKNHAKKMRGFYQQSEQRWNVNY
ncbi:MAG: hypothetical protein QNK23_02455 [Crocinitomicaceae bacterium]|nr:hypothetical protein [Crocinitomicaceae bacterium]